MARPSPQTVFVTSTVPAEIIPPQGGRSTLTIHNPSVDSVWFIEDTIGTADDRLEIPSGGFMRFEQSAGCEVPQGRVYVFGNGAVQQRVIVRQ